jgi:diguanylate cyclase (GGDEF)-like protein
MSLYRLRTDSQFAIATLFGGVAVIGILPFAIYRFSRGQMLAGVIDTGIMLCICGGVIDVWRGGDLRRLGVLLLVVANVGGVLIASLLGLPGLLWMYPVIVASFLLVSRARAITATGLAIAFLVINGAAFDGDLHRAVFLITAIVVSLFAWIFAHRAERQRLQLESLASHDALTGTGNRRAMEQELPKVIEVHRRQLGTFALALLDLDHFKRINDNFGHEAGDETLMAFADLMLGSIRTIDRLYRFGGEEFVLLLPGVAASDLRTVCENLRLKVANGLRCRGEAITVSIGAAALYRDDDAATWLARADEALYRAKDGGRNRVEVGTIPARACGNGIEPGESGLPGS